MFNPPDPLELWDSDPFRLVERDGAWYGRGAHDDKGELVARVVALRLFREKHGFLPRVKFVVEGEEEIGSPHLANYVRDKKGPAQGRGHRVGGGWGGCQGAPLPLRGA